MKYLRSEHNVWELNPKKLTSLIDFLRIFFREFPNIRLCLRSRKVPTIRTVTQTSRVFGIIDRNVFVLTIL